MNEPERPIASRDFPSIQVQSILYNMPVANIERALAYLNNAARIAATAKLVRSVSVSYGDCSEKQTLSDETLANLRRKFTSLQIVDAQFFQDNLGSAAGHNKLLQSATADFIMILNPDVLVAPNIFAELLSALGRPGVGLVEARQLPVEHPKAYDVVSGETSWASTACVLGSLKIFRKLAGFDAETFFLYCDDVDFSWRIRLAGYMVVMQSSAVVMHDKTLGRKGEWISSSAERYYSAEAGLLLPYKYSRPDLVEENLRYFIKSGDSNLEKAAATFELRRKSGRLPDQIDADHMVAEFKDGAYAVHRF